MAIRVCRLALLLALLGGMTTACTPAIQQWNPQDYTVKPGDTLYSIAWRYEKDYRDIARWNDISPPYAIYPGQRLSMTPDNEDGTIDHGAPVTIEVDDEMPINQPATAPALEPVRVQPGYIVVQKGDTLYSLAQEYNLKVAQLARWNFIRAPYHIHPGQKLRLSHLGTSTNTGISPVQVQATKPPAVSISPVISIPSRVSQWNWPVPGEVIKTFDSRDTSRKGIGIAGNRGQAVKAAADGQVVYSGNGLVSYGNLVIIKHSNAFLSAYAHNKKLLVHEGEVVKAGQTIANMGAPDNGPAVLHFEIRKNGKPVNPLIYLPQTRG